MKYRREIDGLRAVAVVPVILFHGGVGVFSGGFVGVDIFFVISGYLITGILIAELAAGNFSIARFYERRARRILPALFVVMAACLPFAWMWMFPAQLEDFSQSLGAVVVFLSNILFWREDGYFAAAAELKPLLHTWSLAVEEQYYVLFPILLWFLWRFGRRAALIVVVAIALLSLGLTEWAWRNAPAANFYFASSRAWELLAGSICAFLLASRAPGADNRWSLLGLALIVVSIFSFDEATPFPSLYALAPVGGTVLIVLFAGHGTWVASLLSTRPLVGIGLISYSAYLWHQPLFAFARIRSVTEPGLVLMSMLSLAALVLAYLTWAFVEQPFRRRPVPVLATRGRVFAASAMAGALFLGLGGIGFLQEGFPKRGNGTTSMSALGQRITENLGLGAACDGAYTLSPDCRTAEQPEILLWGDSFAMHLAQGLVASEPGVLMQQHTLSSCAPILGLAQAGARRTLARAESCMDFNDQVLDWLKQNPSVKLVFLSSSFEFVLEAGLVTRDGAVTVADQAAFVAEGLAATAEAIRSTGARVVIISPPPTSGWDIGQCLIRSSYFGLDEDTCDFVPIGPTPVETMLRRVEARVPVYWLANDICPKSKCDSLLKGRFLYSDTGHLSREGSEYLGRRSGWVYRLSDMAQ